MGHMAERAQIIVKGIVQGVGFRPFVFNLADSLDLKGYVTNTSGGVLIEVEGTCIPDFVRRLKTEAPPLSQITDLFVTSLPLQGSSDFTILKSTDRVENLPFTLISPDVSICDDCRKELLDPNNRRYLYPFINCTNCGPRYSITRTIPYDRPNTTMADFTMCPECLMEYGDPRNRRFHAQPNACPTCGPAVEFRVPSSEFVVQGKAALVETIAVLKRGGIVAVKGLGGFHIACDASNDDAVKRLREKKRKSNKPFAVMVPSVDAARRFCILSDDEEHSLLSGRRPVVLLHKGEGEQLSESVSPKNHFIGVMLPYTPLHYLLFSHPLSNGTEITAPHFTALVMTSGNLAEEPIVHDNDEAVKKLSNIVDGFLTHNRDIFMRVDDSVVRVRRGPKLRTSNSELSFIRRSRGHAPDPILLPDEGPEVLGCGADLKNTFTLTKGKFAIPSQHIGDMENYESVRFYEESLANLKTVYRADPKTIVHDLHPGYLSTRWAMDRQARNAGKGITLFGIQHHYAHIGSVMAEHGLKGKILGVAFDGTGYGTDGNLWGGEFLIADVDGFERAGQFEYMPLPGGDTAIKEPWRTATSLIMRASGDRAGENLDRLGFVQRYGEDILKKVMMVARSSELSLLSSGAGRLFDAVSALLGVCDRNTFEGEAAMALESLTQDGIEDEYPVEFAKQNGYTIINFKPAILNIISDIMRELPKARVATMFHNTVASVIRSMVGNLSRDYSLVDVALSGGTFQNLYLLRRTIRLLTSDGINVFINQKVPCNDGGISLGQAYLVRERLKRCSECGVRSAEFKK